MDYGMVKEKNLIIMANFFLKENFGMAKDGPGFFIIVRTIKNQKLYLEKDLELNFMIMEI